MVFNPLFFNTLGKDSEAFSLKSLKPNSVNYLFADIIKVYANDASEINSSEIVTSAKQNAGVQNQTPFTVQEESALLSSNVLAFLTLSGIKELVKQNISAKYNSALASANTTLTFDGKISEETGESLLAKLVESLTDSTSAEKIIQLQKNQNQLLSVDDIKTTITDLLKSGKPVTLKVFDNKVKMEFNLKQLSANTDKNDLSAIEESVGKGYEINIIVAENKKINSGIESLKSIAINNSSSSVLQTVPEDEAAKAVSGDKNKKKELSVNSAESVGKSEEIKTEINSGKISQTEIESSTVQQENKNLNVEAVTLIFNISTTENNSTGSSIKPGSNENKIPDALSNLTQKQNAGILLQSNILEKTKSDQPKLVESETQKAINENTGNTITIENNQVTENNKKADSFKELFTGEQKQAGNQNQGKKIIVSANEASTEIKPSVAIKGNVTNENKIVENPQGTMLPGTVLSGAKSSDKTQTVATENGTTKVSNNQTQNTKTIIAESETGNVERIGKNKTVVATGKEIKIQKNQSDTIIVKNITDKSETKTQTNQTASVKNTAGKNETDSQANKTTTVKNASVKIEVSNQTVTKNALDKSEFQSQVKNSILEKTNANNKSTVVEGKDTAVKSTKEFKASTEPVSFKTTNELKNNLVNESEYSAKNIEEKAASNILDGKISVDVKTVSVQSTGSENKTNDQPKTAEANVKATGNSGKQILTTQLDASENKETIKLKMETSSVKFAGNMVKGETDAKQVPVNQTKVNSDKSTINLKDQISNTNITGKSVKNESASLKSAEDLVSGKTPVNANKFVSGVKNEVTEEQLTTKTLGMSESIKGEMDPQVKSLATSDKGEIINTNSANKTTGETKKTNVEQKSVKENINILKEKNISKPESNKVAQSEIADDEIKDTEKSIPEDVKSAKNISTVEQTANENKSEPVNSTVSKEKEIVVKTNVKKVFVLDGKEEIQIKQKSINEKPVEKNSPNRNIEEEVNLTNAKIKSALSSEKILFALDNDTDKKAETQTVKTNGGTVQIENNVRQENIKETKNNSGSRENEYSSAKNNSENSSENTSGNKKQSNENNIFAKEIASSNKSNTTDLPTNNDITKNVKYTDVVKEISKFILKKERSTITLNVEPESFGKIKVTLDIVESSAKVVVEVENEAVKKMIENNISQLFQSLNQNGLALSSMQVSTSGGESKQAKNQSGSRKKFSLENEVTATTEDKSKIKSYGYNTYEFLA